MAGDSGTLYVRVTRDLPRRVYQHRNPCGTSTFTSRYRLSKLVCFEATDNIASAIAREKQIKGMRRDRKIALIEAANPAWRDLAIDWFQDGR
jgi:putative endonuclease